jgi:predicted nucleic acid-binding protein
MRWCFGDGTQKDREYAGKVLDAIETTRAIVPAIWGLEVANVIARAEMKGVWPNTRSQEFLAMLNGLDIDVDEETFSRSLSDTLQLARRYKLSAYDASYLELASRLEIPMATLDENLQKAAQKAGVKKFTSQP